MTARTPRHHYHSQRSASFGLTITAPTSYLLLCALFQYSEGKSSGAGAYMLNIDTKSGLAWRVTVPARCIAYQLCQLQEVKRQSPNLISLTPQSLLPLLCLRPFTVFFSIRCGAEHGMAVFTVIITGMNDGARWHKL